MAFEDEPNATGVPKIDLFNMLALCLVQPSTCENVLRPLQCSSEEIAILQGCVQEQDLECFANLAGLECLTIEDILWANATNAKLETITSSWDGQSESIVGNLTQA